MREPHPSLRLDLLRRRDSPGRLVGAFALALLAHMLCLPVFDLFRVEDAERRPAEKGAQLVRLSRGQWDKNRRIELDVKAAGDAPTPPREPKKPDDEADAPGKVVTLPPPEREERPDTADYASEYDQRAERETRSRDARQHFDVVARSLQQGQIGVPQPPSDASRSTEAHAMAAVSGGPEGPGRALAGDSGTDERDGRGQRALAFELPRQAAQAPLKLRLDLDGVFKNRDAIAPIPGNGDEARVAMGPQADALRRDGGGVGDDSGQGTEGGGVGKDGLPSLAGLTPSVSKLAKIMGAPANDYLPEVEVDAETRLNAWRWKHATFFNRIADAIRREWQGGEVLTSNDPNGRIFGFEDRMTVLSVTLDRAGNVVSVAVAEQSGAYVLDDEAVRAFKQAGPFVNPPPQLFKGEERFTFLFGFNVSYNRTSVDLNWRP